MWYVRFALSEAYKLNCKLFKLQSFWQEMTGKARRESGANFSEAKSQLLNKDSTEKHESP